VKRVLVDVNVVLDVLMDRRPHAPAAASLWTLIERRQLEGYLAAHGLTTIHYLARRAVGTATARRMIHDLLAVFSIAPVDGAVLQEALMLESPDFEDAVAAAAAARAGCEAIVTRDPRGFRGAPLPSLDPASASLACEARPR
jgi:predicted nucleic acid-binding protein